MRPLLTSLFCGTLFALGLGLSGMTQPGKVIAFLDFTGEWDPSLMFVMAGAILVYAIGYRLIRPGSMLVSAKIDGRLAAGSAIFGVGWGLAGYCPGPALVSLVSLRWETGLFVLSMLAGMIAFEGMWGNQREKNTGML